MDMEYEEEEEEEEEDDDEEQEKRFSEKSEAEKSCALYYYSWDENKDLIPPHYTRSFLGADKCPFGSMDFIGLNRYSISELTDNGDFSDEQFIQHTEDGKLYHGNIKLESGDMKPVTVKIFGFSRKWNFGYGRNVMRFDDEVNLMTGALCKSNPKVVDVLGVCVEHKLAVVYDLKFHKSLYDVISLHDFGWVDRIKVAAQLADVLAAFHDGLYILCVFNSSNVMVDENYNVKIFDLSRVVRVKSIKRKITFDAPTRRFHCYAPECLRVAKYSAATDVYAFGSVLLELISKEADYDGTDILLAKRKESLVDESLSKMTFVASEVADLVRRCLHNGPRFRPTMKEVSLVLREIRNPESSKKQSTC